MKKFTLFILTLLTLTLSCSDYDKDIKTGGTSSTGDGIETEGTGGPLPAEFTNTNDGSFSEKKMLVNIGVNVIFKNVREFSSQTELLRNRIAEYCDALDENSVDVARTEEIAKDKWEDTMLAYHMIDVVPVGPINDKGRFISDNLYAWPLINPCGIDEEVAKMAETGTFNPKLLVNIKGLGALEYILFESTLVPKCSPAFNKKAIAWGKKPMADKKRDRCRYAKNLTDDIVAKASLLEDAWNPEKGNFTKTMIDGSRYEDVKLAVNALTDAMFSIEKLKDDKLAKPLGIHAECKNASGKCPEMAEHQWSGLALRSMEAQLTGFKEVFWGSYSTSAKAFGFDDYLAQAGHPEISVSMKNYLSQATATAFKLSQEKTYAEYIATLNPAVCDPVDLNKNQEPLCAFYSEVRDAAQLLKEDMMIILALSAPAGFQGDND